MTFSPAFRLSKPASTKVMKGRPARRWPAGYGAIPPHAGNLHSTECLGNSIGVISITEPRWQYLYGVLLIPRHGSQAARTIRLEGTANTLPGFPIYPAGVYPATATKMLLQLFAGPACSGGEK
jgi:hypothetical protein